MLIIPAVDILGGAAVRLTKGDYATKKVYDSDPVAVARRYEREGARMIHVVDLDGAKTGKPANRAVILRILKSVKTPIEVGGGIRSLKIARDYLEAGASRVVLGTKALEDAELVKSLLSEFGENRIVVALETKSGKIATEGWQKTSDKNVMVFAAELRAWGVKYILFTDVDRDGTMTEPNYDIALALAAAGASVIASGGVSDIGAIEKLKKIGVSAAIIGKALYEGKLTLAQAEEAARPRSDLTKRIVPCLDVKDGKVVKGVSFENLKDVGDPVALGKKYSDEGADELVFLDISASKEGRETMFDVVERVAKEVFIPFTVGGGISTVAQMRKLLQLGAEKVSINTAAVQNPELITEAARAFGSQCVVVAIDAKRTGNSWKAFLKGGSEETQLDAIEWAKEAAERGAGEILLISMDSDGTKDGHDIEILRKVSEAVSTPVIASGGAGTMEHLREGLTAGKADAVLVASLFHYGEYSIRETKEYLAKAGIPMRM